MGEKQKSDPSKKHHPWRLCPEGEHWVRAHPRDKVSSKGNPYTQSMPGTCYPNRSSKDHLYKDEIEQIKEFHLSKAKQLPTPYELGFPGKGNQYDSIIALWTQYWNEIFISDEPMDPDLVKALIASESGFNPTSWNKKKGKKSAHGLMQVTKETRTLLSSKDELKNQYVDITVENLNDPNANICAGIRWLYRKKQIEESQQKKKLKWTDSIESYKGYKNKKSKSGVTDFKDYYERLKSWKKQK